MPIQEIPSSQDILDQITSLTGRFEWPQTLKVAKVVSSEDLVHQLHRCNYAQWNLEELIREADRSLIEVAELKKKIDRSNYLRNKMMEGLDALFSRELPMNKPLNEAYINSQTLGQMIDTMSIFVLKSHFVSRELKARQPSDSVDGIDVIDTISTQLRYVTCCYEKFREALVSGKGHMLPVKQFKLYKKEDWNEF